MVPVQECGREAAGSEAAKFRLWVKSKGLQLGEGEEGEGQLILPTGTDKVGGDLARGGGQTCPCPTQTCPCHTYTLPYSWHVCQDLEGETLE